MWQNSDLALALHRARAAEARRRPRSPQERKTRPEAARLALRPAPAPWAR